MIDDAFARAVRSEPAPPPKLVHGPHWLILLVALLPLVAACTPSTTGGVRGHTSFAATARVETHTSPRPAAEVAACFKATATFLPKSRFTTAADGSIHYTLAGFGLWFEEIDFTPTPDGSRIEVRTSGAYDAGWVTMLVRDRLEPLGACLKPVEA
jgi:hypothetical protein